MQLYIISILTNKLFDVSGDLTEVGDNGMLLSGESCIYEQLPMTMFKPN